MAPIVRGLRLAGAIAVKDGLDAIRKRVVQVLVLGVLMMLLTGSVLPLFSRSATVYRAVVYDPGRSQLVQEVRRLDGVQLGRALTTDDVERTVAGASSPVLGLLLPGDLDQRLANREPVTVSGCAVHWVREEDLAELRRFYERALTDLAGQPVRIVLQGERFYPTADTGGYPGLSAGVLVMALMTLGVSVAPYLVLDEQETGTLDPLLASLVGPGQVVLGKAVASTVYGLAIGSVGLLLYRALVVHWQVALLGVLCGTLVGVCLGLALGLLLRAPQALNTGLGLALLVLLVPALVHERLAALHPAIRGAFEWYPSVAVLRLVQASFAKGVIRSELGRHVGVLAVWAVLSVCVAARRVRSWGR